MLYTIEKIVSRSIKYCPQTFKINLIWERYEHPKLWDNKSPSFGLPLGSLEEKWHLDLVPTKKHKLYYREGSGALLKVAGHVKLTLEVISLSPSHHFHSTCINHLLVLVVQVDIIMNFCFWVCPSPILEL